MTNNLLSLTDNVDGDNGVRPNNGHDTAVVDLEMRVSPAKSLSEKQASLQSRGGSPTTVFKHQSGVVGIYDVNLCNLLSQARFQREIEPAKAQMGCIKSYLHVRAQCNTFVITLAAEPESWPAVAKSSPDKAESSGPGQNVRFKLSNFVFVSSKNKKCTSQQNLTFRTATLEHEHSEADAV